MAIRFRRHWMFNVQRWALNVPQSVLIFAIRVYRWTISPVQTFLFGLAGGCRFTPTCSQYALEAIHAHGAIAGGWLAMKRICRCHPWGEGGSDPVPECGMRPSALRYDAAGDSPVLPGSAASEGGEAGT